MFPDVESEEGLQPFRDGIPGIAFLGNDQFAFGIGAQPYPSGSEESGTFCRELFTERFETAELSIDEFCNLTRGDVVFPGGAELKEIHVMVEDLSGIVEYAAFGCADDLLECLSFESRAGNGRVEIVYVRLKMLSVMEGYCLGADCRCKCLWGIGKFDKFEHCVEN